MSIQDLWNKAARKAMLEKNMKAADIANALNTGRGTIYNVLNKNNQNYRAPMLRVKVSKLLEIPTPDEMQMNNKKSL